MIAKLLRLALTQRFLSVVLGVGLVALGVWAFMQLSVEAYPDISDTQVVVITLYPGHAAEEVEQQVTIPIERALNSTPNVIARRSRTIFGLSVVELTFEYGTNDYFARQVVLEKLRDATLPDGVTPSLGPLSTPIGELYRYTLDGRNYDSKQLREIEDWIVEPRLLQVAGVTDITPFGGTIKQYQIEVDPIALGKYGLSIKDIAQAVDSNNQNAGGALLDNRQQGLVVRGVGLIQSIADIENVVVSASGGVPVFVRDVGRVHVGPAPRSGIIAVGTLVMVEHIVHALSHRQPRAGEGALDVIRDAALEVERPIFFSLLIIVSAYIPLFTLERVERRLFTPMAFTVCYALIGSMLIALTLIPVLATYLFRRTTKTWDNPVLTWLAARYERALAWSIAFPTRVVAIAVVVVAAAGLLSLRLGSEFLPQLDEGVLWIRANFPAGISLDKSADLASTIRSLVGQSAEVKTVSSQTGRNDDGTDPYGPNRNEFFVALAPYDTWPHGKRKSDLIEELNARLRSAVPGAFFSFTQPIIDNVTEAVTGSPADLAVIITGPDLAELRRLGQDTLGVLQKVAGAADTGIEQEEDQAQLRIRIDRQAVARYGINVRDVQDVIELAIGGRTVSTFFEGERRFDIAVRYVPEARTDPSAIGTILVATRDGGHVPLSQLAEIQVVNGASIIARRENHRQISERTNIRGRDQGGFVQEAQERFAAAVKLPDGYRVEWGGQFENLARARRRLAFILPITILVIFCLLFFTFGSVSYAGLVLLNVPFSLVGGILALYLRGINLSVSAAVGFISLLGLAVMSGVLVVSEISARRADRRVRGRDAVVQGSLAQMRPVLMMIVVAMLGMVPAAFATGVGSDVQRPLATVVVGGLLSTLVLTLLALPALYWLIAGRAEGEPS